MENTTTKSAKFKRMDWSDGWHTSGVLEYRIEDGCFKNGVKNGKPVYPYLLCKTGGYDNVYGIKACKRNWERISWF